MKRMVVMVLGILLFVLFMEAAGHAEDRFASQWISRSMVECCSQLLDKGADDEGKTVPDA